MSAASAIGIKRRLKTVSSDFLIPPPHFWLLWTSVALFPTRVKSGCGFVFLRSPLCSPHIIYASVLADAPKRLRPKVEIARACAEPTEAFGGGLAVGDPKDAQSGAPAPTFSMVPLGAAFPRQIGRLAFALSRSIVEVKKISPAAHTIEKSPRLALPSA